MLDSEIVEEGEEDVCDVRLHEHGGDDLTISKSKPMVLPPVPLKHEDIFGKWLRVINSDNGEVKFKKELRIAY